MGGRASKVLRGALVAAIRGKDKRVKPILLRHRGHPMPNGSD
jgi:hypothetical protein